MLAPDHRPGTPARRSTWRRVRASRLHRVVELGQRGIDLGVDRRARRRAAGLVAGRVVVQPTKARLLAATAQTTATVRSEEMGMANSFAENMTQTAPATMRAWLACHGAHIAPPRAVEDPAYGNSSRCRRRVRAGQRHRVGARRKAQLPRRVVRGTPHGLGHVGLRRHRRDACEGREDAAAHRPRRPRDQARHARLRRCSVKRVLGA